MSQTGRSKSNRETKQLPIVIDSQRCGKSFPISKMDQGNMGTCHLVFRGMENRDPQDLVISDNKRSVLKTLNEWDNSLSPLLEHISPSKTTNVFRAMSRRLISREFIRIFHVRKMSYGRHSSVYEMKVQHHREYSIYRAMTADPV